MIKKQDLLLQLLEQITRFERSSLLDCHFWLLGHIWRTNPKGFPLFFHKVVKTPHLAIENPRQIGLVSRIFRFDHPHRIWKSSKYQIFSTKHIDMHWCLRKFLNYTSPQWEILVLFLTCYKMCPYITFSISSSKMVWRTARRIHVSPHRNSQIFYEQKGPYDTKVCITLMCIWWVVAGSKWILDTHLTVIVLFLVKVNFLFFFLVKCYSHWKTLQVWGFLRTNNNQSGDKTLTSGCHTCLLDTHWRCIEDFCSSFPFGRSHFLTVSWYLQGNKIQNEIEWNWFFVISTGK